MALFNMAELSGRLAPGQRLIGLDPGARRIGVALSDVERRIASPYGTLARGKIAQVAGAILEIARGQGAGALVIGWPLSMDGTVGPAAQSVRDWALALSEATGLPAALWDERLSSVWANRVLIEAADLSRAKRASAVDRLAAAAILQSCLDYFREQLLSRGTL